MAVHTRCRGTHYYGRGADMIKKFEVPDHAASWETAFPEYQPVEFTTSGVKSKPVWADPDITETEKFSKIQFNQLDGQTQRKSFHKDNYKIINGRPQNPYGRTGISGRGHLGKWGPNHAADPVVTRWKRDDKGEIVKHSSGKPILQFVSIQRKDTHEWAIPGGMVDADEEVSLTLKREFSEEALNSLEEDQKEQVNEDIKKLFNNGEEIYRGYCDDPRNTDNSWMETVVCNFHDENGTTVGRIPLAAGDDAQAVVWKSIDDDLTALYASHLEFVKKTCERRGAHF